MQTILKLLHPYTPYITEELWSKFSTKDNSMLIIESWPTFEDSMINPNIESNLELLKKQLAL